MTYPPPPISVEKGATRILTFWNVVAALLVLGFLVFLAEASRGVEQTLAELRATPVSLDPTNLPNYAARTSLRMLAAMLVSLLFTFTYATWAAKSRREAANRRNEWQPSFCSRCLCSCARAAW